MGDYERSTTVELGLEELFTFLADVENLPLYMDRMTEAHLVGDEKVEVEAVLDEDALSTADGAAGDDGFTARVAEAEGSRHTVHGEAWFRVDSERHAIEWGSEGPNRYRGDLEVSGDDRASRVTVRLSTEHDAAAEIDRSLEQTLQNIERVATAPPPSS